VILVDVTSRADTKNRLDGFITWGEEIILGPADLFLVSSSVFAHLEIMSRLLPPIDSGDITSGVRNNENGTFGHSAESLFGLTEDRKICRQPQRF
jgi:hypothetical protein